MGNIYEFKMVQTDGTEVIIKGNKERFNDVIDDFVSWALGGGYDKEMINRYINWSGCED